MFKQNTLGDEKCIYYKDLSLGIVRRLVQKQTKKRPIFENKFS